MRDILFKAKTKGYSKPEWVFGYLLCYYNEEEFSENTQNSLFVISNENGYFKINENTVCQYTGKKICGEMLFEGDIIEIHGDFDDLDGFTKHYTELEQVVYDNNECAFVLKPYPDDDSEKHLGFISDLEADNDDFYIVGNIFDWMGDGK